MDPITLGLLLSAGSGILGGFFGDKTNKRNLRAQQQRQGQIDQWAQGLMQQGPTGAETQFLNFLTNSFSGEEWNAGQDSLMQMLRSDPVSTDKLFQSWEPLEQRALDTALGDFWGTTSGLGQRFGSAAARETGRIRGEAAENSIARRAQTSTQLAGENADRRFQAANALQQMILNATGMQMGGYGTLGQLANQRQGMNAQLLGIMAGGGAPMAQPSGIPGAMGDISQLLMMLPFLQQLQGGGAQRPISWGGLQGNVMVR